MIYLLTILTFLIGAFLLIVLVVYFQQDRLIFHNEKLPINYVFSFDLPFEEINLKAEDGSILNGLHFIKKNPKGIIVYFHNHAGNIARWGNSISLFYNAGYDVVLMDYRTYGKSEGGLNEHAMVKDAQLWYNYAMRNFEEEEIILYGKGLGSYFATVLASNNHPKLLLLESAVYNLEHIAKQHYPYLPVKFILKYKINTVAYFSKVHCNVFLFHGNKDAVNHFKTSQELASISPRQCEVILIEDADNTDVMSHPDFVKRLLEILNEKV